MIAPEAFYSNLKESGVRFFCGVPDSLLKDFCAFIEQNTTKKEHLITANEGASVALAAGHHFATGEVPLVYMQNSGLGNTVNPLVSLASKEVYQVPMILLIGWRGEPEVKDEPQHQKQGEITPGLLECMDISYKILDQDSDATELSKWAVQAATKQSAPVALLVKKNTFSSYKLQKRETKASISREQALSKVLDLLDSRDIVVSTTGKTSRELYELRESRDEAQQDFLTVGSMGHSSSIALGVALQKPKRRVVCLDGDGSVLMHMGPLALVGSLAPQNFIHILLNNHAHESVGGQATVADKIDFKKVSEGLGYKHYQYAESLEQISESFKKIKELKGPIFFEIFIATGSRSDLGRPKSSPKQNKESFMKHVQS